MRLTATLSIWFGPIDNKLSLTEYYVVALPYRGILSTVYYYDFTIAQHSET